MTGFTREGSKNIEDIRCGDYVLAEDPETGELAYKEVVRTFVRDAGKTVHVTVDGDEIETTSEHPFWVEGKGFVNAGSLQQGDMLRLSTGENARVESVWEEVLEEKVLVYNFEVEDFHTYFVSELGVLVHNECSLGGKTSSKPNQVHHYATNKSKKYTSQFEDIANKYGLDLDDAWNKELMSHQGRHPYAYHDYVLDNMQKFDKIANGDTNKFLKLYEQMKQKIISNPEMLYKDY